VTALDIVCIVAIISAVPILGARVNHYARKKGADPDVIAGDLEFFKVPIYCGFILFVSIVFSSNPQVRGLRDAVQMCVLLILTIDHTLTISAIRRKLSETT
jgi:ABC-type xylose transport system permease subunit